MRRSNTFSVIVSMRGCLVLNNIMGPFIAIAAAGLTFFAFWVLSAYLIHHCFISPRMVM